MAVIGTPFQQELLKQLDEVSPVYIVGGAVRNQMLDLPSRDLDVVIALPSEIVEERLKDWGYVPHRLGQKHPTVTLFDGQERLDVVEFNGNLFEDAMRRDFTLNAIYSRVGTTDIEDPVDGVRDLRAGILRACGRPLERFRADPLRVLRLVRLAVQYRFEIDEETWEAAVNTLPLLSEEARERVTEELSKILLLEDVEKGIRLLDELGYWQEYVPELARLKGLAQNRYHTKDAWEHTLHVVKNTPPQLLLRLAALWHDLGKWETASRECRVWGKIQTSKEGFVIEGFKLKGKGLERWQGKFAEVLGGRLDNHPDTIVVKRVNPLRSGKTGFEWVPDGKRHFLEHERYSAKILAKILPRFIWNMFLQVPGRRSENELIFLIENHMAGTLAFMSELRGEGKPGGITNKVSRFAWNYGWDGREYYLDRIQNLLNLWKADFFGGKQRSQGDEELFNSIYQAILTTANEFAHRLEQMDWTPLVEFAQNQALAGEEYGRFKNLIRQKVLLEGLNLENTYCLEEELRKFRRERR